MLCPARQQHPEGSGRLGPRMQKLAQRGPRPPALVTCEGSPPPPPSPTHTHGPLAHRLAKGLVGVTGPTACPAPDIAAAGLFTPFPPPPRCPCPCACPCACVRMRVLFHDVSVLYQRADLLAQLSLPKRIRQLEGAL